jgi:hypothetical protein
MSGKKVLVCNLILGYKKFRVGDFGMVGKQETGLIFFGLTKVARSGLCNVLFFFIIYLVVIMQNLHGLILVTSQLPISARRAKMHINISTRAKNANQ